MEIKTLAKKKQQLYSLEAYFQLEEKAAYKSEFRNGKIKPISGGTIAHNRIKGRIYFLLCQFIDANDLDIEAFDSDQKTYISAYANNVYPDISVVIGAPQMYQKGNQAITNPALIIEVISNSTGNYDRSEKFRKYQTLSSFQEYVLVDQYTPVIDVFYKKGERDWQLKTYIGLDDVIQLHSINATLKMSDIYKKVKNLQDPQSTLNFDDL